MLKSRMEPNGILARIRVSRERIRILVFRRYFSGFGNDCFDLLDVGECKC